MDAINYYMIDRGCDAGLKERVREFFVASRTMQRRHRERRVVSLMSPALQGEVAMVAHSKVVSSVYYFKDASADFTLGLSRVLHSRGYAQREMIWSTHLNIMHQAPTTTITTTTISCTYLTHSPAHPLLAPPPPGHGGGARRDQATRPCLERRYHPGQPRAQTHRTRVRAQLLRGAPVSKFACMC